MNELMIGNVKVLIILALLVLSLSSCKEDSASKEISLVPYPNHLVVNEGTFSLNDESFISINSASINGIAEILQDFIGEKLSIVQEIILDQDVSEDGISLIVEPQSKMSPEEYQLDITNKGVKIRSGTEQGLFYGVTTLMQLISNEGYGTELKCLNIIDAPRFKWRGMHLDVSRHFMPVDFIKKYIDILAMYKLNIFHWHLVDDVGWRIEIKSHPELTDIGAWRVVKKNKNPWEDIEAWKEGDQRSKYGGFYSQEEIKEVVKYAEDRFVTIVPEIELPGHSFIVFECFDDLVCTNDMGSPLENIGVYCASNPDVYSLLEDVISEVVEIFPSEYIHIGGDEVSKRNWETCSHCSKMMRDHRMDSDQLQSHFVNHFDEFLSSKNRKLIGWHEITQGDLSATSSVMFWHGMEGLNDVLSKNHPTVIASGSSYYFDHYQSLSENEPEAWGGFTTLSQVYNLEPLSLDLDKELQSLVLGIQGQVWTEYMPTPSHVEYMSLPRMLAISESAWTLPENKNWNRFSGSLRAEFKRLDEMNVNYSKSALRPIIQTEFDEPTGNLLVTISSEIESKIYYTIDGAVPAIESGVQYSEPFVLDQSAIVSAVCIEEGKCLTEVERLEAFVHKARGCSLTFKNDPHPKYSVNGGQTLVDLEFGGRVWGNEKWIGVLNQDLDVTIQLEEEEEVSEVLLSCLNDRGSWIYFPESIEVLVSMDGESFDAVGSWQRDVNWKPTNENDKRRQMFPLKFDSVKCKYVQLKAKCAEPKETGAYIFADEIIVQ